RSRSAWPTPRKAKAAAKSLAARPTAAPNTVSVCCSWRLLLRGTHASIQQCAFLEVAGVRSIEPDSGQRSARMRKVGRLAAGAGAIAVLSVAVLAQWPSYPTGPPRDAAGQPILDGPPPKAADGHPDLSGIWALAGGGGGGRGAGRGAGPGGGTPPGSPPGGG